MEIHDGPDQVMTGTKRMKDRIDDDHGDDDEGFYDGQDDDDDDDEA